MKDYKISEYKDEIITHIIKNLIWLPIASIIPLIFKLINFLYDNIKNDSQYITLTNMLMLICIILSILSITICIANSKNCFKKYKTKSNNNEISCDYRFNSIIAELTFDDDRKNITSTLDYKMIVLSDSATELKRDIIWSGSKYNGTKIIKSNGDYELIDSNRSHSPHPYKIVFNSEKSRGETIELKTETSVVDENLDMLPQYSFMVKYQIDKLIIRVIAPKNMINNVKKSVYADRAKEVCIEQPSFIVGDSVRDLVRYTYEINNPTLLYNYFIEWEFTN